MSALRHSPTPADCDAVRALVASTGYFSDAEEALAAELVAEAVERGAASGYEFLFADGAGPGLSGYACFGPVPATESSFDLYWIVVAPGLQRQGLGRSLLAEAEERVREQGGTRLYVDTSGRDQYGSARAFYQRMC